MLWPLDESSKVLMRLYVTSSANKEPLNILKRVIVTVTVTIIMIVGVISTHFVVAADNRN